VSHSILLVDDDPDVRDLLGSLLADQGFEVHTARDGHHALHVLEHIEPPRLIILDYVMPEMNGPQFLAAKRRDPRFRFIPVVVLSAWTRQWTGAKLRVAEVLSKPVDLERLLIVVASIVGPTRPITIERRRASRGETAARFMP
jgi:CheY-like chemotaxis protein